MKSFTHKKIEPLKIRGFTGYLPRKKFAEPIKHQNYRLIPHLTIDGDAPKDLVRVYEYGEGIKSNVKTWPIHIAKLGDKHYPNESITEYLLGKIGEWLGFDVAQGQLRWINGQLRYLSKFFLKLKHPVQIMHGAQIYAGYLNDPSFVHEIENQKQSGVFFTVQFTREAIAFAFPNEVKIIMQNFYRLLFLDAYVGNNDRHYYNWGVLHDLRKKTRPTFTPIYDTARGLYWNYSEQHVKKIVLNKDVMMRKIAKYSKKCQPKIGWEKATKNLNHFELVKKLCTLQVVKEDEFIHYLCGNHSINRLLDKLKNETKILLSNERRKLIAMTLVHRHEILKSIFNAK